MTAPQEDRFWVLIGKACAIFGLVVTALLVAYALTQLYQADQSYVHDTTPLQAPDTAKKVTK